MRISTEETVIKDSVDDGCFVNNRGRNAQTNRKVPSVQNRSCIRYSDDYNEEETYKIQLVEVKITQKRRQLKEGD